ncbi:MAG: hypothetical protein V3W31_03250 [Thermodesulfobacteriota bacterium]
MRVQPGLYFLIVFTLFSTCFMVRGKALADSVPGIFRLGSLYELNWDRPEELSRQTDLAFFPVRISSRDLYELYRSAGRGVLDADTSREVGRISPGVSVGNSFYYLGDSGWKEVEIIGYVKQGDGEGPNPSFEVVEKDTNFLWAYGKISEKGVDEHVGETVVIMALGEKPGDTAGVVDVSKGRQKDKGETGKFMGKVEAAINEDKSGYKLLTDAYQSGLEEAERESRRENPTVTHYYQHWVNAKLAVFSEYIPPELRKAEGRVELSKVVDGPLSIELQTVKSGVYPNRDDYGTDEYSQVKVMEGGLEVFVKFVNGGAELREVVTKDRRFFILEYYDWGVFYILIFQEGGKLHMVPYSRPSSC